MAAKADPRITQAHFELLRNFGRWKLREKMSEEHERTTWEVACRTARLPVVSREEVVDAWRTFVTGESDRSSLAVNGDVDPNFVSIGVAWDGKLVAAHTTRTRALLRRVLSIFRRVSFSDEEYLEAVRELSVEAVTTPARQKQIRRRRADE